MMPGIWWVLNKYRGCPPKNVYIFKKVKKTVLELEYSTYTDITKDDYKSCVYFFLAPPVYSE